MLSRGGEILSAFLAAMRRVMIAAEGKNMIANAVFVATLMFLALGFGLMSQMHFLVPWRNQSPARTSMPIPSRRTMPRKRRCPPREAHYDTF